MKKLIISLIASFLHCAFAYGQPNRPDPVEEHRKVEKWLEGHKAEEAKLERDLEVKIAELRKKLGGDYDENEVEFGIKIKREQKRDRNRSRDRDRNQTLN